METKEKVSAELSEEQKANIADFRSKRTMFYFDNAGNIMFPDINNKDSSFEKWFLEKKINIETTIRGYVYGREARVYIGKDYKVPNLSVNQYNILKEYFDCWDIQLGLVKGEIGEVWKGQYSMSVYRN